MSLEKRNVSELPTGDFSTQGLLIPGEVWGKTITFSNTSVLGFITNNLIPNGFSKVIGGGTGKLSGGFGTTVTGIVANIVREDTGKYKVFLNQSIYASKCQVLVDACWIDGNGNWVEGKTMFVSTSLPSFGQQTDYFHIITGDDSTRNEAAFSFIIIQHTT